MKAEVKQRVSAESEVRAREIEDLRKDLTNLMEKSGQKNEEEEKGLPEEQLENVRL